MLTASVPYRHSVPSLARDICVTGMEFSVSDWLRADQAAGPNAPHVAMSMPHQVFCWSRQSEAEGGQYLYGDAGGE